MVRWRLAFACPQACQTDGVDNPAYSADGDSSTTDTDVKVFTISGETMPDTVPGRSTAHAQSLLPVPVAVRVRIQKANSVIFGSLGISYEGLTFRSLSPKKSISPTYYLE